MSDYIAQYEEAAALAGRMAILAADQNSEKRYESAASLAAAAQAQATLALAAATMVAASR